MRFRASILTHLIVACMVLGAAERCGQAIAAEPESLLKLRALFEQKVRIVSGLWNDYYARALGSLESDFAAKGDYEQARAVKARRDELASLAAAAGGASAVVNAVPLPAESAKFSGAVSAKSGELIGWRTSSCAAEWPLPRLTPGSYRLQLTYTMSDRPADPDSPSSSLRPTEPVKTASFGFREVSLLVAATKNQRALTLEPTPGTEPKTITVETPLELTKPPFTLRLSAMASYPANVIVIRDVKLVPVMAASVTTTSTTLTVASLTAELDQLRQSGTKQLVTVRKPLVDTYVSGLEALVPPGVDGDERESMIEAERRRVMRMVESTPAKSGMGMKLDNFEEISGVKFVPDPANSGDRFKVEHEGKQFFVRLAWVKCPPSDPADAKAMKQCALRFGADELQMPELGLAVKEFTALYLEGRALHLLLRHSKKDENEATALVFLESIGLFQGVLIDHGLAVLDAPSIASRGSLEASLLAGFQDRENAARKQSPAPGGWGLKTTP